jgi:CoA:oxalate CoA-transferase
MTPKLPLKGVKVLELGALVAAPYCSMLLADLGAEVVKIEPPGGDMSREFGPFLRGESSFFMSVNRGKKSVCLDLKNPLTLEWVLRLVADSDVVLHNFRTGVAEKLGLGYEEINKVNPRAIYCAISGFGPTGSMGDRPGIDLIFQAESGMISITGTPEGPPVKVGSNAADVYAATMSAFAIMTGLYQRNITGVGSRVDVALRDAFVALQACWFGSFFADGQIPQKLGAASPFTAPTDIFKTLDSEIVLAVVNEKHWKLFCNVLEIPELMDDKLFANNISRLANVSALKIILEKKLILKTTSVWLKLFELAKIPAGRVLNYDDISLDDQILNNEMVVRMDHSTVGEIKVLGVPIWLNNEKPSLLIPPPALGQHTREVLNSIGCPSDIIESLIV